MKIELDQYEVNLTAEALRIQIDRTSKAQKQNNSKPDLASTFLATRQIQELRELLKKVRAVNFVPDLIRRVPPHESAAATGFSARHASPTPEPLADSIADRAHSERPE